MPRETRYFRKKPVVVEAERFEPYEGNSLPVGVSVDPTSPTGFRLQTLEHTAVGFEITPGDWIITGVNNERYAIKADILEKTYEEVPEREAGEAINRRYARQLEERSRWEAKTEQGAGSAG